MATDPPKEYWTYSADPSRIMLEKPMPSTWLSFCSSCPLPDWMKLPDWMVFNVYMVFFVYLCHPKVGSSILPSSILSYYHGTTLFVYIYLLKRTYPLKLDGVRRQSFPFGFASGQVRTVSCGGGYLFQTYIDI